MGYFSSSEYVDLEGKPRWDAFGKVAGELRQFADDIKVLGSIAKSDEVNNAECVLLGDYSDDEKTAAGDYLENRRELVDSKLNGID